MSTESARKAAEAVTDWFKQLQSCTYPEMVDAIESIIAAAYPLAGRRQTMTAEEQEIQDRKKVRELCSTCIVRLFQIMGQLNEILDIVRAIDVPELSAYVHVSKLPKIVPVNIDGDIEKQSTAADSNPSFTPTTKSRDAKGDPLAELAAQLSPADREKLISSLEGGKK